MALQPLPAEHPRRHEAGAPGAVAIAPACVQMRHMHAHRLQGLRTNAPMVLFWAPQVLSWSGRQEVMMQLMTSLLNQHAHAPSTLWFCAPAYRVMQLRASIDGYYFVPQCSRLRQ